MPTHTQNTAQTTPGPYLKITHHLEQTTSVQMHQDLHTPRASSSQHSGLLFLSSRPIGSSPISTHAFTSRAGVRPLPTTHSSFHNTQLSLSHMHTRAHAHTDASCYTAPLQATHSPDPLCGQAQRYAMPPTFGRLFAAARHRSCPTHAHIDTCYYATNLCQLKFENS